jgi:hypothetical protein
MMPADVATWNARCSMALVEVALFGAARGTSRAGVQPEHEGVVRMKKLSKKSALLFASVMAMAAFTMPTFAAAATWSAPGALTGHTSSLVFTGATAIGNATVNCTARFTGDAVNTGGVAAGTITSITFGTVAAPCVGGGIATGCTADWAATSLPWGVTTSGTNVTIGGISATLQFTGVCGIANATIVMEGSVTGAWINGSGSENAFTLSNASGLGLTLSGSPFGTASLDGVFVVTGPHL